MTCGQIVSQWCYVFFNFLSEGMGSSRNRAGSVTDRPWAEPRKLENTLPSRDFMQNKWEIFFLQKYGKNGGECRVEPSRFKYRTLSSRVISYIQTQRLIHFNFWVDLKVWRCDILTRLVSTLKSFHFDSPCVYLDIFKMTRFWLRRVLIASNVLNL